MKRIFSVFILTLLVAFPVVSQNKKDVLLTIDGAPVYANEFKRVYNKNLDLVQEESQKDIDGYLQLFIDYKLKTAEARAQGLDDKDVYKSELKQYRAQLSRNYLFEDKVTEEMAKEAYERGKEELNVTHILIPVDYEANAQDTLKAYNKIKSIHDRALKGEDFKELARKYSEEPGAKETGGELGYFSVFNMVYPFETAAYNTKVGEVSDIFRTRFGYHILKVNDRRTRVPKISVSHIMISEKKGARTFDPEVRIKEIAAMINQGESFESLAKQYSDDKNSAEKEGKLNPFVKGDLRSPQFEDAAYKLKTPGEISDPVKSEFGWHLIRLDEILPMETFEEQKPEIEKKLGDGERSKMVTQAVSKMIKDKYGFKAGASYLPYMLTYIPSEVMSRKWVIETPIPADENKLLFSIGDRKLTYNDFAKYVEGRQRTTRPYRSKELLLADLYEDFEDEMIKDYFRDKLEEDNEEYAAILDEYRDGLLIFDVMEQNIWEKAKNDSIGLQKFYEKNKMNYQWKKRVDGDIFGATSQITAQQIQTMLNEGKTPEDIKTALNQNVQINVLLTQGVFEVDQEELPKDLEMKIGISKIYNSHDSFVVINIKEVLPPSVKPLNDVRGRVISVYQNEIEKEWMNELRSKYDVEVNKKTLRQLKKELK
ncbi:MAG TPA: peptidylprolyl isomerase [Aequorivita sp.]|nr:peptidylprolyl isomerase [Aequorivita sp.]